MVKQNPYFIYVTYEESCLQLEIFIRCKGCFLIATVGMIATAIMNRFSFCPLKKKICRCKEGGFLNFSYFVIISLGENKDK